MGGLAPDLPRRSNSLFAGSLRAGQWVAVVMSLVHLARLNGRDLFAYLRDALQHLPMQSASRIAELQPHHWRPVIRLAPAQRARCSDSGREVQPNKNAGLSVAVIGSELWELLPARPQPKPGRCAYGQPQQNDDNGTDSTAWLSAFRLHPVLRLDAAFCKDFGWQELDG